MASKVIHFSIPFFYMIFFCWCLSAEPSISLEIPFPATQQEIITSLSMLPDTFFLETFSIESDVPVSENEFKTLFNGKKNTLVARKDLELGVFLTQKKNRFEKIELCLTPTVLGYSFHIELYGHWTFYKIKIHGFLLNKDQFGTFYLIEPGQRFDLDKHQRSLERIKDLFKSDGYFNADIREDLVFNEKEKTVYVHLTIDRKSAFRIEDVRVAIDSGEKISLHERETLAEKIQKNLTNSLQYSYYNKNNIQQEFKLMKRYLRKKGIAYSKFNVIEEVHDEEQGVGISCSLCIDKQKRFTFFGNHYFSETQLFEKISVFGKESYQIPVAIIAAELEDVYKKNGFLNARIEAEEDDDKYVFVIKEGVRSYIGKILFDGNERLSSFEIQKTIAAYQKNYLDHQTQKKIIDELLNFYRAHGFWDVSIAIQDVFPENDAGIYGVRLRIFEGKQRFYAGSNATFISECLDDPSAGHLEQLETPIPFDITFLDQQRQALMQKLFRNGYLNARIKPEFVENGQAVGVEWKPIGKMQQVNFGKTVIVGNSRLPYEKISREIAYKEGVVWDREKIARTVNNIRNLGVFESVSLYPVDDLAPFDQNKSLILQVVEGSPMEARLRLGYQHVSLIRGSTYKIGGSLLAKNPTNNADLMRFDADMTRFYQSIALVYERPWLFNMALKSSVRAYVQTYEQPLYMGSRDILYTADHDGFCANFDRTFEYGDIGLSLGCDWLRTRGLSPQLAQSIQFDPRLIERRIPYLFFEPHLLFDVLDDSINPTRGALTLLSMRTALAPHCFNLSLTKILIEQSLFFPCSKRIVGAVRIRFGNIFHQEFQTIMPHDRFYLGGPHSLRSIEPNMAPPLGVFGVEKVHVPIGGKTMFNINLEVRVVLNGNLGGVLFQDIGVLIAKKVFDVESEDLSAGTGFGLRYATPMGPIRFDFAVKWKKRFIGDCRTAWFLTFGHAF